MSAINSLTSSGYYALNNQNSSNGQSTGNVTLAGGLAEALAMGKSTTGTEESAYSLDLSADALAYIKSINGTAPAGKSSYSNVTNFVLTRNQQETLNGIIEQYKDAPFTQETFNKIQDALEKAGLSTKTLSAQDSARNFNATKFLLDALNGTTSSSDVGGQDTETKSNNFMTSVADQWARISTTAKKA